MENESNNLENAKHSSFIKKTRFYQHYKYKTALYNLVKRDFIVKYRRSILGIFWSVLNPLLMMIVISAVFSYFFRFEIEIIQFTILLAIFFLLCMQPLQVALLTLL